ncbi:hypothetical protein [Anaerosporobacter faecicola]|uniref:hypothetical protein n=1 Tax=Anaerosporobacter faecicola TaxID=2718714 RepID=UPI00143B76AD|nr:hypothetical protein [Anaerosporobacter faecicola]
MKKEKSFAIMNMVYRVFSINGRKKLIGLQCQEEWPAKVTKSIPVGIRNGSIRLGEQFR